MKKTNYLLFCLTLLISGFSFAQSDDNDDNGEKKNRAPFDFLDIFNMDRRDKKEVMTQSEFLWGVGFNQALGDDNGIGEDYRFWGSGYFDVGVEFSTRLSKASNSPRLTYGLSLRASSLRISGDDRQFSTFDNVTTLQPIAVDADRSRFYQAGFHAPIHLEFGKREVQEYDEGLRRYGDGSNFVFGVGGYLGYITTSTQSVRFDREGRNVTSDLTNDFEINNFNYGLSLYAGYEDLQLYASYGLNDIFKDSPIEQSYVTLGIRLRG
ncbi:MAG: hypothetical protein WBG46_12525 [Nonlabens sp.]